MADAQSTFALDLEDGTSGPAEDAASALQNLRSQIDADTKALAAMQKAMKNLQGGTSVNVKQFKELKAQIDLKKQALAQNTSAVLAMGGSLRSSSGSGKAMKSMLEQITKQAQGLPGPLAGVVGQLSSMRGLLAGGLIALGLVAIAAGMAAVTVAAIAATAALLKYGVSQADAHRSELLRLEGLTKIRNWYGVAAGSATELQQSIDSVASRSAIGRDQLAKYAEQLYRTHLRGQNLTDALEGMAIKASTQGEAQAQLFASWAAGANMAGGSVKKLADDVKARLGGIAARQMLALDVQAKKMRESFDALFRGLRVEGLLKALNMVTELFSQNTVTGRALKVLVETIFQPMIGAVEFLAPLVKRFFQGIVVSALLVTLGLLKLRKWFKATFGDSEILKGFDATEVAFYAGVAAASALVAILGVVAIATAAAAAPLVAIGLAIWGVISAVSWLAEKWAAVDWSGLGRSIVDGIVSGVKRGASWVYDTIGNLGKGAWRTFKQALGIASPSKAFARLGLEIPRGVQVGIQSGQRGVDRDVRGVVEVPRAPRIAPSDVFDGGSPGGAAIGGRAPVTVAVDVGGIHVQGASAREQDDDLERRLERVFERVAIQFGARLAGST